MPFAIRYSVLGIGYWVYESCRYGDGMVGYGYMQNGREGKYSGSSTLRIRDAVAVVNREAFVQTCKLAT